MSISHLLTDYLPPSLLMEPLSFIQEDMCINFKPQAMQVDPSRCVCVGERERERERERG